MQRDFQNAAIVLHASRFAKWLDGDFRVQFLVRAHSVKIDMQHITPDRVMLHFLDQRETAALLGAVGDFEIDQHVLARRAQEQIRNLALVQRKIHRLVVSAVDGGRNESLRLDFFNRSTSHNGALPHSGTGTAMWFGTTSTMTRRPASWRVATIASKA